MCLQRITAEHNEPLAAAHACIGDDRYDLVEYVLMLCAAGPHWTSQISYEAVASLLRTPVV